MNYLTLHGPSRLAEEPFFQGYGIFWVGIERPGTWELLWLDPRTLNPQAGPADHRNGCPDIGGSRHPGTQQPFDLTCGVLTPRRVRLFVDEGGCEVQDVCHSDDALVLILFELAT